MRFLLPTFPAYILAGIWMLATFLETAPRSARIAVPLILLAVQGLWGADDLINETRRIHYQKQMLARVTDKLDEVVPSGSVILANNQILQDLDFVRKWKLADQQLIRGGFGGPGGGPGRFGPNNDPDAPSPMQREKREEQQEKYTGTQYERQSKFAADVRTWAAGRKVYLVGSENEVVPDLALGARRSDVKVIARIEMPEAPVMETRGGGFGPGGGMGRRGMGGGPGMGG